MGITVLLTKLASTGIGRQVSDKERQTAKKRRAPKPMEEIFGNMTEGTSLASPTISQVPSSRNDNAGLFHSSDVAVRGEWAKSSSSLSHLKEAGDAAREGTPLPFSTARAIDL